jgi:hypothetical protein
MDGGEADASAFELGIAMEAMERQEEFGGIGHVEAGAVVGDGEDGFGSDAT